MRAPERCKGRRIGGLITGKKRTIDISLDAYWRYNDEVDRAEALMVYKDPRAHNYYKNDSGRSAANNPIDIRKIGLGCATRSMAV